MPCNPETSQFMKDETCRRAPGWASRRDALFLATCRDRLPISTVTCDANHSSLSFVWESFAGIDLRLEKLLSSPYSNRSARRVLVYSVGAHYFAQFREHKASHYLNEIMQPNHEYGYPQPWLSRYYSETRALMLWLKKVPACVIWKTNNIWNGTRSQTHPSMIYRSHYWLNRWSIAMAAESGLRVFDVMPHTLQQSGLQAHISSPDAYHKYDHADLAQRLLEFMLKSCAP